MVFRIIEKFVKVMKCLNKKNITIVQRKHHRNMSSSSNGNKYMTCKSAGILCNLSKKIQKHLLCILMLLTRGVPVTGKLVIPAGNGITGDNWYPPVLRLPIPVFCKRHAVP
jgi:hypothetical protein